MKRILAVLLGAVVLVVVGAGAGPMSPVARVLEVKGSAKIVQGQEFDRPAGVYGTIYTDEQLVLAKDAHVTLVFRTDGHVERVAAAGTFRVTQKGCRPQKGVEQVTLSERQQAIVGKLSKGPSGIVQGGVVVARSPARQPAEESQQPLVVGPGQIHPTPESTLLSTKPSFAWPALPKAKGYALELRHLGTPVWSAKSETSRLDFAGETPLEPGYTYKWKVTTTIDGKPATVCEGMFQMATDDQREEAAELEKLLAKPDPICLAVAAMWYKQNGMLVEALAANEQLVKLAPDVDVYRELAGLYFETGRDAEGNAAEDKALTLEKKAAK